MATMTHQQALNLAMEHHGAGRLAEAESLYRQLLAMHPQNPDLWNLLGVLAHQTGRTDEGLELIRRAIAAKPNAFDCHNNLALMLTDIRRFDDALTSFENAIRLQPACAEAHYNMGITLGRLGRAADAVTAYRTALRLRPDHPTAALNLGNALVATGKLDEAVAHYRAVLARQPGNSAIANNLGNLLKDLAQLDEAIALFRTALVHSPNDAETHSNLGVALKDAGDIRGALESFQRSLSLNPNRAEVHSNFVFTRYFDPSIPAVEIAEEHRRWDRAHAAPLRTQWRPHPNDRSPERRLRVGYVSPDFRDHVVGRTLLPCFEAHDRSQFDFYCYSAVSHSDAITARFRSLAAEWRDVSDWTDAQVAEQIRQDRVDILVDLALHTAFNRLPVFARKPAPVQVAWLGYPGATGMDAMDYRITDPFLDPPGHDAAGSFEEPLRLPDCWCCHRPAVNSPAPSGLPAAGCGFVKFGSFNNFAKINDRVLALWAEIMASVEGSRLLLLLRGSQPDRTRRFFEQRGIGADRVEFLAYYATPDEHSDAPPPPDYLHRYHRIDIALDPFPYNGMTTTCDALWMGVPVVALVGGSPISRASFSLLSNVGLPELTANTEREYARLAVELARDLPRLASLRATLREKMKASPLLDAARFTRNLDAAFRAIWRRWCEAEHPGTFIQ